MNTYKIIIAYDGTDYAGWQVQPAVLSVSQQLQKTFYDVFKHPIKLVGSSRTDAGVHALGQVAIFKTSMNIESKALLHAWNNLLPADIIVRSILPVSSDFHPQANVAQKTYWYHVFNGIRPLPFIQRYGYYCRYSFDPEKLCQALHVFVGTHDFRSFCTGWDMDDTVRTIDSISLHYIKRYKVYRIEVKGPGFLRYMIRRIVGACLEVASRRDLQIPLLHEVLAEKNPEQTLPKAPAKGLLLYKIKYRTV